jgi:solute carrier family 8 (sodium/calcium exchanger)
LSIDTKASEKITALITKPAFCSDMVKLSPVYQTSRLEAFHSLIIHFAPKSTAFSYQGIMSRLHLAALHYNENRARETARTREGTKRYAVEYPKYKMGGYIVRPLVINCTYGILLKSPIQ